MTKGNTSTRHAWRNLEDAELDARIIYVGAYGFRDSDTLGRVWAHTERQFAGIMRHTLMDTARMYQGENETLASVRDSLWYVGPFAQTVLETLMDAEDSSRVDEMRDDIRLSSTGYVY